MPLHAACKPLTLGCANHIHVLAHRKNIGGDLLPEGKALVTLDAQPKQMTHRLEHRDRDDATFLIKNLGHPNFLAQDAFHVHSSWDCRQQLASSSHPTS